MYTMLCTRLDICFVVRMVSKYQFNLSPEHGIAVKHMIKYLKRTKNYMLGILVMISFQWVTLILTSFQIKISKNQLPIMCLYYDMEL